MKRRLLLCSLLALLPAGADAADVSPFGALIDPRAAEQRSSGFTARLGAFAHVPGSPEGGPVDVNAELLF